MKIALIIAMEEEFEAIKPLVHMKLKSHNEIKTYHGQYNNTDIIAMISGIGKVNAAIATTIAIERYHAELIINIGSCGGMNQATIGSCIITNQAAYSDVDVTAFGHKLGQIPGMPEIYTSKADILSLQPILTNLSTKYTLHQGLLLTADSFISSQDKVQNLKSSFPTGIAIDMEAAAIGQCCHLFDKEFLFIKKVSDMADAEASSHFSSEILKINENTTEIIKIILSSLC